MSPTSQTVAPGGAASFTVTVSSTGGYEGTVNLAVTGLPEGVSETFSAKAITSAGTSSLTLQTTSAAAAGTYSLTITGTGASGAAHSVNATLVIGDSMTVSSISYCNRSHGARVDLE